MMSPLAPIAAALALTPATTGGGADRHDGFYRFASAPAEHCIARARAQSPRPARPTRLTELPPAYAIRLTDGDRKAAQACFRLVPEPQE